LDAQVNPDGTFEFHALYGLRAIQPMGFSWAIDSLQGPSTVQDRWFVDVVPGVDIPNLRLVVTNPGWLFATVIDESGKPFARPAGAFHGSVLVMPVDPAAPDSRHWGFYDASNIYSSSNGEALARIENIAPGAYLIAAIDVEPYRLTNDTDLMERARAGATLVQARSGAFDVRLRIVRLRALVRGS
jgi:hypothetical protein